MLKQRASLVSFFLFLLDEAVTVAAFVSAYWIRHSLIRPLIGGPLYPFPRYLFILYTVIPVWALLFWFTGLYRSHRTIPFAREAGEILKVVAGGGFSLALLLFLTKSGPEISRFFILLFLVLNALFLMAHRLAVRGMSRAVRRKGYNFRNILIVGTDRRARNFEETILRHPWWGIIPTGFIEPDGEEPEVDRSRVLGKIGDLPRLLEETVVDEVIFVVSPTRLGLLEETFLLCEELGIRTRVVMEYLPRQMAKVFVEMVEGVPVLTFTTAPIDATSLLVKRILDVTLSLLLLALASPLMLLAALLVKLTSPGPVLFRQVRCGLNGRNFTLFKFRSMYRDAEERRKDLAHLNVMDGPVFKAPNDPRITPVGRLLRSFSLDELPQLWNILRGDMSFVGPRPPVPQEVREYQRWQRRRLSMKPGLTGLWQVSGRNTVDFDTWMKLDLEYIDTWSLWLDVRIILRTIPTVLSRRGAM
jgi:exopolysaccharide biosynthesis polyprenyl glycosylphosphotransferase